jgi:hypothetical protein
MIWRSSFCRARVRRLSLALEHLSAVLFARSPKERTVAERNARAFLTRMTRLRDAKGTIANEAQRVDSGLAAVEREIRKEGGQVG